VGTRLAGHQGEHKLTNLVTAGKLPAQDNAGMEASYGNHGADDCTNKRDQFRARICAHCHAADVQFSRSIRAAGSRRGKTGL
jgi:hypothetical protein